MNDLRIEDIYWIAGFLEGEGSFMRCGGTITVQAAQVQKDPIDKLVDLCQGRVGYYERDNPKHNNYYRWAIYGEAAELVMKAIYPIMSSKRKAKIGELLSWYATRPGRNFVKSGRKMCRKQLHEWTEANTFIHSNGGRTCRPCNRASKNAWQVTRRASLQLSGRIE